MSEGTVDITTLGLALDSTQIEKGSVALGSFSKAAEGAAESANQFGSAGVTLGARISELEAKNQAVIESWAREAQIIGLTRTEIIQLDAAHAQLTKTQQEQVASIVKLREAQEQHTKALKDAAEAQKAAEENMARWVKVAASAASAVVTFAAALYGLSVHAAQAAEQVNLRLDAALKASGERAGVTRVQIEGLADALKRTTQFDDEGLKRAAGTLLSFQNIGASSFDHVLKTATDLAAFLGGDLNSAVMMIGRAMDDPAAGMMSLRRAGIMLTESQRETIKALSDSGDALGAQKVLLEALDVRLKDVAETMNSGLAKSTHDAQKATSDFLIELGNTELIGGTYKRVMDSITFALNEVTAATKRAIQAKKDLEAGQTPAQAHGINFPGQLDEHGFPVKSTGEALQVQYPDLTQQARARDAAVQREALDNAGKVAAKGIDEARIAMEGLNKSVETHQQQFDRELASFLKEADQLHLNKAAVDEFTAALDKKIFSSERASAAAKALTEQNKLYSATVSGLLSSTAGEVSAIKANETADVQRYQTAISSVKELAAAREISNKEEVAAEAAYQQAIIQIKINSLNEQVAAEVATFAKIEALRTQANTTKVDEAQARIRKTVEEDLNKEITLYGDLGKVKEDAGTKSLKIDAADELAVAKINAAYGTYLENVIKLDAEQEFRISLVGKSADEVLALVAAHRVELQVLQEIARLEQQRDSLDPVNKGPEIAALNALIAKTIESRDVRIEAAKVGALAEKAAQDSFATGWQNAINAYAESLTGAKVAQEAFNTLTSNMEALFVGMANHAKDAFSNFTHAILQMLEQIAAKIAVSGILQLLGVGGVGVGGGLLAGVANAFSGGGGNQSGGIGGIANIASTGYNAISGAGGGFAMSTIGQALGLSAPLASTAGSLSLGVEAGGVASGALGLTSLGAALTPIMAALPWAGLAAIAIPLIGKLFDKGPASRTATFASGAASLVPDPSRDAVFQGSSAFGAFGISKDYWLGPEVGAAFKPVLDSITTLDNSISQLVGGELTKSITDALAAHSVTVGMGTEGTDINASGGPAAILKDRYVTVATAIDAELGKMVEAFSGTGDELAKFVLGLVSVYEALQSTDLEKVFGEKFGIDALVKLVPAGGDLAATFSDLVSRFNVTNDVAIVLGRNAVDAFGAVGLASADARKQLVDLAGGLDNLSALTSSYYQNFFSEAERTAKAQSLMTDELTKLQTTFPDLMVSLPATREEFRALVESIDPATESGRQLVAELLKLSPAFASITPDVQVATVAVQDNSAAQQAATQAAAAAKALADKKANLEIQIMQLTGDSAGALAAQRQIELDAMDASLVPLQQRIYDLQDEAAAAKLVSDAKSQQSSLFDKFATSEEKSIAATAKLTAGFGAFGLTVPKTTEGFLQLVQAQDPATESGRKMLAMLSDVAPAFDAVTAAANDAAAASTKFMEDTTKSIGQMGLGLFGWGKIQAELMAQEKQMEVEYTKKAEDMVAAAKDNLSKAYQREASELRSTADAALQAADSLKAMREQLMTSADSGQSPFKIRELAGAQLNTADATTIGRISSDFLGASKLTSKTALDYQRDVARVQAAMISLEMQNRSKASLAEEQLAEIQKQTGALIDIKTATMSVADALVDVAKALQYQRDVKNIVNAGGLGVDYMRKLAWFNKLNIGRDNEHVGNVLDNIQIRYGGAQPSPPSGPDFPTPSAVQTPSAAVANSTTAIVDAINSLVTEVRAGNMSIASSSQKTARILQRFDGNGMPAVRDVIA